MSEPNLDPLDRRELLASFAPAAWSEIGRSVDGRQIVARRFDGDWPPVLLFGAIHGDEPLGVVCLRRLAEELAEAEASARHTRRETWIVPVVSPDGFLADTKDNAHGVDLNRNWPAKNWSREHPHRYDPGPSPLSEPETRALHDLIDRAGARRLIALHSPFRTVNYDGSARALAERMGALNGYGASADIGYPTPGSFGSFYGVDRGWEVVTLEIPPLSPDAAWAENRMALYAALDL